jgi:Pretoxin HINT domain
MGTKIEPKHALLYQSGNVAGIGTSFILGMRAPTWATTKIGPLKWTASALTGLDLYGAGKASYTVTSNFIARGNRFEWSDTWNLLSFVPFAGLLLGGTSKVKNFFAANKAAQSLDNDVQTIGTTATKTGNCFVAGTEILTSEGEKKIEDIQVGDWVVADDPNTVGEIEYKQVLDTFVRHTDKLVDLYIDGEVISTTGEHPFWTPDKGWVEAKDLTVGSLVQTSDGLIIDVDRVDKREGDFTVYNFKVEGFHTYFVSEQHILVHNADCEDVAKLYKRELGGGMRVKITAKNGEFLVGTDWFNHTVFVKKGMVYDPMRMGSLGDVNLPSRSYLTGRDLDKFDANPTPWAEWLEAYGGREGLNFKLDRSPWEIID